MDPLLLLVPVASLLFFAALWTGIVGMLSIAGGWRRLAAEFPAQPDDTGHRFTFASASLGRGPMPVNYNHVLTVRVGNRGIGLSVLRIFGFMHPPLTIPWSAVEDCRRGHLFIFPVVEVVVRGGPRMRFRGAAGEGLLDGWSRYRAAVPAAV